MWRSNVMEDVRHAIANAAYKRDSRFIDKSPTSSRHSLMRILTARDLADSLLPADTDNNTYISSKALHCNMIEKT
ncbi:hypothetical protein Ae201684P_017706 [Aphanomyces euteiches]|uniref:Uncharacterized protein n=1 Tax=Aphanomyces euteiches TaxID=100861 RepID=A0A6G0XMY5_9STRA|nr:hypothetical protein Ae201684_003026 [Aphanomyces euteiches]KAH9098494.1 hypothetical protein Ae201684P_017706 [Aphanomyces euteiches]